MPAFDDLLDQLELPQCTCLNASSDHTLRHALDAETRDTATAYLESDADEELLITLKFMSAVRISGLVIGAADDADAAPKVRASAAPKMPRPCRGLRADALHARKHARRM